MTLYAQAYRVVVNINDSVYFDISISDLRVYCIKILKFFCLGSIDSSWLEWIFPSLPSVLMWLLNLLIAGAVCVKIFMFGEPISKPPSVSYWRSRNQADVYLRRVC